MVRWRRLRGQAVSPSCSPAPAPGPAQRNPSRERDSLVSFAPPSVAQRVPDEEAVSADQQHARKLSVDILDGPPSHDDNTFDSEDGLLDVGDDIFNDHGRESGVSPWNHPEFQALQAGFDIGTQSVRSAEGGRVSLPPHARDAPSTAGQQSDFDVWLHSQFLSNEHNTV
ncbi:hypothetical protein B0H13DRAFT_1864453 [Mycena leptocephala]|nr:hypothetical protein B0H13DRAFT_1864453 [Mycena leptocephala]